MPEVSLNTRKVLARAKMRDLLLSAATQKEARSVEREREFLQTLLQNLQDGQTTAAVDALAQKLKELGGGGSQSRGKSATTALETASGNGASKVRSIRQ